MLNFTNDPPKDSRGTSLPLTRCPTIKSITGIILSNDLVGTATHYYRGRTLPCDNETCPACDEGSPWRWHAYFALYGVTCHRTVLFECTAKACEPIKLYRKAYGTIRGCLMTAKRANASANSRVLIQTDKADLQKFTLPDAPDVIAALSIIWNIPIPAIQLNGLQKDMPALNIDTVKQNRLAQLRQGIKRLSDQHKNGNGSHP